MSFESPIGRKQQGCDPIFYIEFFLFSLNISSLDFGPLRHFRSGETVSFCFSLRPISLDLVV